ncbi:MAG: DUF4445 domain-containing protein [Anaerolineales bacterium]|nr:DUF4445 domain-containing protein [Anaerolineales bacterium]
MSPYIDFEPIGLRGECPEGNSLLDCARSLGVCLVNICGGVGNCGSCKVQILAGKVSEVTGKEREHITVNELSRGYRLACCVFPETNCKVFVPAESLAVKQRAQVEGREIHVDPDPAARMYLLDLAPPSFKDLRSDADRIADELRDRYDLTDLMFDYQLLRSLSDILRKNNWRVLVVVYQGEVIAVLPEGSKSLGVAVDLGTTKIAMYLMDLESGQTLSSKGLMNPQVAYGEDIMTRMTAAQTDSNLAEQFQSLIVDVFNETIAEMCRQCGQCLSQVVNMVVAGNTAMHHLFLGFPVWQLGRAPYVPEVASELDIKARDLGIRIAPGAYVHLLPNIAGYVGGDHVAMLLASNISTETGVILAIDVGTNTEICLSNRGIMSSLSTASGPAFEGAHLQHGMRAAPGAIERFQVIEGKNTYQTIDNLPAVGLCGSGILDVLAQLYQAGFVDRRGRFMEHPCIRGEGREKEYEIVPSQGNGAAITFSQRDIEQLQLAKGAIRTGIEVLLVRHGISASELDKIIIAGAFGTYLDVSSAITIGMLPELPVSRVFQVGNAAGIGAKLALISREKRDEAQYLARKVQYIELAGDPDFTSVFAKSLRLG